jgi:hypothetical protein
MSDGPPQEVLDNIIPLLAIGGGMVLFFFALVAVTIRRIVLGRSAEQSRREIAAYVAEGTISPDDAVKLLNAGKNLTDRLAGCCGRSA